MGQRFTSSLSLIVSSIIAPVAQAQSRCTLNGRVVPCEELAETAKGFLGMGLAVFGVLFVVGILSTIFWIIMLVHAATKPIENKAMWLILMVLTGIIGAVIYYFAVKRSFDRQAPPLAPGAPKS